MIKSEVRSLIKNLLPKYGFESEFHPRFIDAAIEKVLAQFYNEVFAQDPLSLQRYCKRYGGTVAVAVTLDAGAGIYYSTHPAKHIPFPDKASGIRRIATKVQGGIAFYPIDQREMDLVMAGSYFDTITSKIGYCVTQDRVEYYNMSVAVAATGVRMDIVVPFSVYADTDNVLVPEIKIKDPEGKILSFTDAVMQMLSVIKPADLSDDNSTESTVKEQK